MNDSLKLTGICLLSVVLPVILRLLWEATWLGWKEGPEMSNLGIVHQFPQGVFFAGLCWIALFLWLGVIAFLKFRERRRLFPLDRLILSLTVAALIFPAFPQRLWSSATELALGPSPKSSEYLVSAALQGNAKDVQKFLNRGISSNSKDIDGCAALAAAAGTGQPALVALLLSHHADPNSTCADEPAIVRATRAADLSSVQLLTNAGADLHRHAPQYPTAYATALLANHADIAKFLATHGGQ